VGNDDNIDPHDGVDLGTFRYAVARLLRLLIRARLTQEPEFLDLDDRRRWQDESIHGDSRTIESFLLEAVKANDILYNNILGPGNSVGIAPGDPRDQFKETVISVMTALWTLSEQWIAKAKCGECIDWDEVIPIDVVRVIRDGLDSLPHPTQQEPTTGPDGPVPPASFRWKGCTAKLTSKPWALVNFLWKQPSSEQDGEDVRCSDFFTIAREIWDKEDVALGRAINSTASRANGMFEEVGIPIRLSICKPDDKHQYVTLVISDTDA
jgi:hypothetical protein